MKSAAVAAVLCLAAPAPAQSQAQTEPFAYGDYWEFDEAEVVYGKGEAYLTHLAGRWRSSQEFAKQRGFIKDYAVMVSTNPRSGEPHLYLVTVYANYPTREEEARIRAAYGEWMRSQPEVTPEMQAELARIRTITGSRLLRQIDFLPR